MTTPFLMTPSLRGVEHRRPKNERPQRCLFSHGFPGPARHTQLAGAVEIPLCPAGPDLCLSEILCFKDAQKVGRDNTVKYNWRVMELLPDQDAPATPDCGSRHWNGPIWDRTLDVPRQPN